MAIELANKTPNEEREYPVDWSNRIATGDSINGSDWLYEDDDGVYQDFPGASTLTEYESSTYTSTGTILKVGAGTHGVLYRLLNRVTTAGGRTYETFLKLRVLNAS